MTLSGVMEVPRRGLTVSDVPVEVGAGELVPVYQELVREDLETKPAGQLVGTQAERQQWAL